MTTETAIPTNADPEVQRVLRALVEREVFFNVGFWVQALTEAIQTGGSTDYVDYDEVSSWWQGEPDKKQAILDAGYDTTEHDGQWYWYESDDPEPYGDDPPADYEVEEYTAQMLLDEEEPDLPPGWYWGDGSPDLDESNHAATQAGAVAACWDDLGLEAFDDEEDAIDDCIYMNNVDVEESRGDVLEHWAVTSRFADLLQARGEAVFDICGSSVWGRQTSGQAIWIDHVIWEIGKDMEILPGQENHRYWTDD